MKSVATLEVTALEAAGPRTQSQDGGLLTGLWHCQQVLGPVGSRACLKEPRTLGVNTGAIVNLEPPPLCPPGGEQSPVAHMPAVKSYLNPRPKSPRAPGPLTKLLKP